MLNNRSHFLLFKLHREEDKRLRLSLPIPLYIFQELFDSIADLLELACLFVPRRPALSSSFALSDIKALMQMTMTLFDSLSEGDPYDLVDVTANKIKVSVKIR
jgi:hypothetical protein